MVHLSAIASMGAANRTAGVDHQNGMHKWSSNADNIGELGTRPSTEASGWIDTCSPVQPAPPRSAELRKVQVLLFSSWGSLRSYERDADENCNACPVSARSGHGLGEMVIFDGNWE